MYRIARLTAVFAFAASLAAAQSNESGGLASGEVVVQPELTVFTDWTLVCVPDDDGGKVCNIRQIVLNAQGEQASFVEVFKVADNPNFSSGAVIVMPLGVALEDGLELQVDSALPRRYNFQYCAETGCFSRIGFTDNELQRMMRGAVMKMTVYSVFSGPAPVDLQVSLSGFTDAYNSL